MSRSISPKRENNNEYESEEDDEKEKMYVPTGKKPTTTVSAVQKFDASMINDSHRILSTTSEEVIIIEEDEEEEDTQNSQSIGGMVSDLMKGESSDKTAQKQSEKVMDHLIAVGQKMEEESNEEYEYIYEEEEEEEKINDIPEHAIHQFEHIEVPQPFNPPPPTIVQKFTPIEALRQNEEKMSKASSA